MSLMHAMPPFLGGHWPFVRSQTNILFSFSFVYLIPFPFPFFFYATTSTITSSRSAFLFFSSFSRSAFSLLIHLFLNFLILQTDLLATYSRCLIKNKEKKEKEGMGLFGNVEYSLSVSVSLSLSLSLSLYVCVCMCVCVCKIYPVSCIRLFGFSGKFRVGGCNVIHKDGDMDILEEPFSFSLPYMCTYVCMYLYSFSFPPTNLSSFQLCFSSLLF